MMKTSAIAFSLVLLITITFLAVPVISEESGSFFVPEMPGIIIDGDRADWGTDGFRVDVMAQRSYGGLTAEDFTPSYRLAWNAEGLVLLIETQDNIAVEESTPSLLFMQDAARVEITPEGGGGRGFVAYLRPGVDPEKPGAQYYFENNTGPLMADDMFTAETAGSATGDGYILEVLFPWNNLKITPDNSTRLLFQITVSDIDKREENIWMAGRNADDARRIRLADKASAPIRVFAGGRYEGIEKTVVTVCGVRELAGKKVTVLEGRKKLARGKLEEKAGLAQAVFELPMSPYGETWPQLKVMIRGQEPIMVGLPDANELRARLFTEESIKFEFYVMSTDRFPNVDFERPDVVKSMIGPFTLRTKFYDSSYKPVENPEAPGRYGAVVEIHPENGRMTRRFQTLFRLPAGMDDYSLWFELDVEAEVDFPAALGINVSPNSDTKSGMDDLLTLAVIRFIFEMKEGPALLAGLYENDNNSSGEGVAAWPLTRNRQWWVDFKRNLYKSEKQLKEPFIAPRKVAREPAPVLHQGSLAEAGMKADAAEKIDAVLKEWSAGSNKAFSVCIARHGVIVLHEAYGNRGGKPFELETKSWMASITKLLSATMMMMLVDQGLVGMDDPVADYIPMYKDIEVEKPIEIRNIYTHTGGLWGHWGDEMYDMEEVVAGYYPYLASNKLSFYNGAGNALGSNIIESVSGEALASFYYNHLLKPLGMESTAVKGSMGDARSIPLDMARVAQMLLNRGAYGNMRFMSEETFEKMLPAPMTRQFGEGTTVVKGFGCGWFSEFGLSPRTFGHGAASTATFRIDMDNDLVIVMCRNAAGSNDNTYYPKFIEAIVNGMTD